ncbi:hypothetical protein GCM10023223_24420 [Stackebrandtia albiflava]
MEAGAHGYSISLLQLWESQEPELMATTLGVVAEASFWSFRIFDMMSSSRCSWADGPV